MLRTRMIALPCRSYTSGGAKFPPAWQERHSVLLQDFGFSEAQVERVMRSPCGIGRLRTRDLVSNVAHWCTFRLNEKRLLPVLASTPELLTLSPLFVDARVAELMTLFTRRDIAKLLLTYPRAFLDDFDAICEKVRFVVHELGADPKSIVKAGALRFELGHIRARHAFLARTGRYQFSKKAVRANIPHLAKILSTNITTFLKLSGLTEEEYTAFCDSYEEELQCSSDKDSDEEL